MGRWIRRYHPGEIIVGKPGAIGRHGADWITVNAASGTVSLWDAKFRMFARNVRMSKTFAKTGNTNPLMNAVDEAERIIRHQTGGILTFAQQRSALYSLRKYGTGFNLHTVGFGRANNWVRDMEVVRWW